MMDTELYIRGPNNNSPRAIKNWNSGPIPTLNNLECLNEGTIMGDKSPRRESAGPGYPQVPQVAPRRDSAVLLEEMKQRGRRKSWHVKLERKRRKGVITPADTGDCSNSIGVPNLLQPLPQQRQKRPSWWNIFVPDHLKARSRRASQDVTHVVRPDGQYVRSKSRSVDHGFSSPFDLEALRSKVEGRIESVDKLTRDDAEKKKIEPPVNTITYTVSDRDTLTSVAARFDTTPSELTKLNRLATPFIFAGQVLRVPDKSEGVSDSQSSTPTEIHHDSHDDLPPEEKELLDSLRPVSPKPGHIERVRTPVGGASSVTPVDPEDEAAFKERFLKINVRHITDGQCFSKLWHSWMVTTHTPHQFEGVVGGVLLVTPNAVMFDPNVSDPLVIEHGPESYGVIAPMEFVVNAAIYYDIAHMRVGNTEHSKTEPKADIYYMNKSCGKCSPADSSLLVKDDTFSELGGGTIGGDDADSVCSCAERGGDAFPKAFERDLVTPTNLQQGDSTESEGGASGSVTNTQSSRTLEERRRSMLDHHWAIPSKDRSIEETPHEHEEPQPSSSPALAPVEPDPGLVKLSCHDSGIDIRDPNIPIPIVQAMPTKKVYSDADIVLSSDWVPPITIAPLVSNSLQIETDSPGRKKAASVSFSLDSNNEPDSSTSSDIKNDKEDPDKQETRKNKMLKRLSYPLAWMETLTGGEEENKPPSLPQSADAHHTSVFSKVFSRRSSVGAFIKQSTNGSNDRVSKPPPPRLDYRSMVSVEDMPELFVSFDKLIPRPARSCEDPPLYLRLRMGKPTNRPIPRSTPLMSYGKKKMRPEYWFSVPRNRVDDLYRFLQLWVPQRYGEFNEEEVRARGFEPVESDTELWEDDSPTGRRDSASHSGGLDQDVSELTRESWEVLSRSEEIQRALHGFGTESLDVELTPPDLVGTTEILTYEHREHLCRHLPARAEGYVWTLVFSTSQHGFSLNSMYRKIYKLESPILMVIEDTDNNVFGALTSCALKVSDHFYGTGESLLYRFTPHFQVYNWTGENLYFIKGNNESLTIGAGDGKFGIWLDGDLYQGRTEPCNTYGNDPLSPNKDFVVKTLECWAFI